MGRMSELEQAVSELQKCGEAIIGIANALTEMFSGTGDTAQEPEPPKAAAPEEKPLALEDVRAVLAEKSRKGHTAEIRALLKKYGASKLSGIDPGKYKALLADAEELKDE